MYGWLAYDPKNRYIIDFQIGTRDNETLRKLFKRLQPYRNKLKLVVIDGYKGYEELIRRYLSGKGKHQRPTVGVINKSRWSEEENRFQTYALWNENPRKAERLIRAFGLGSEITTALIERVNGFIRDALMYMRRRTRRLSRLQEWVTTAFTGMMIFHNWMKGHWALSIRTSKNWIKEPVTPAMNAGLTPKQFSIADLLYWRVYQH